MAQEVNTTPLGGWPGGDCVIDKQSANDSPHSLPLLAVTPPPPPRVVLRRWVCLCDSIAEHTPAPVQEVTHLPRLGPPSTSWVRTFWQHVRLDPHVYAQEAGALLVALPAANMHAG
jgi:hypothetical protein